MMIVFNKILLHFMLRLNTCLFTLSASMLALNFIIELAVGSGWSGGLLLDYKSNSKGSYPNLMRRHLKLASCNICHFLSLQLMSAIVPAILS